MIRHEIRERIEQSEERLSPLAAKARFSKGRLRPEQPSPVRTDFQRDRDRIIHSKAFRRLKHKTQVFIAPLGDHYVTRLTHTLEVAQIARSIARALNLNEDLTEAIALAHDLGHTPFGHAGEQTLDALYPCGFRHNEQSLRVVDVLEKDGQGLNLTWEVRDGILKHSKARSSIGADAWGIASTLEGQIVKIADSIAYINHDIGDAIRAGVLREEDLPADCIEKLGRTHSARINTMVCDIIETSWDSVRAGESSHGQSIADYEAARQYIQRLAGEHKPLVSMSAEVLALADTLREFLFQNVYTGSVAWGETAKVTRLLELLYRYFCEHPEAIPQEFRASCQSDSTERIVCDWIAGMTDRYALKVFQQLSLPELERD